VTEAHAKDGDDWTMVALAFTKQLTPEDQPPA
jgi:hypothetical protein